MPFHAVSLRFSVRLGHLVAVALAALALARFAIVQHKKPE